MASFTVHTIATAPEGSRAAMRAAEQAFGLLPNLVGLFADSPAVVAGYLSLAAAFGRSGLTPLEQEVVLIAASVENRCHYCVAAHTTVTQARRLDQAVIAAVRDGGPVGDRKLEALRSFTVAMVRDRGFASDAEVQAVLDAGYSRANVLEVVLGIGLKTVSNYVNHIAETPVDAAFAANAYTPLQHAA